MLSSLESVSLALPRNFAFVFSNSSRTPQSFWRQALISCWRYKEQEGCFFLKFPVPLTRHVALDAPTIWGLPEVHGVEKLRDVVRVEMHQGRFGASSPKPTSWLVAQGLTF